jgi:hypothetical protein
MGGGGGRGENTKRIATIPYLVMYSISYNKYGSFHCQFQGVYFTLMAKVPMAYSCQRYLWLTVANIWKIVLAKNLAMVPQDFPHKNENIFIIKWFCTKLQPF